MLQIITEYKSIMISRRLLFKLYADSCNPPKRCFIKTAQCIHNEGGESERLTRHDF